MQQQLREDLQYQEAEVQRLKDIEGYFQESNEKVKASPGEGEGGRAQLLREDWCRGGVGVAVCGGAVVRALKCCFVERCSQLPSILNQETSL